jgi:hypothetical protein
MYVHLLHRTLDPKSAPEGGGELVLITVMPFSC